MYNQLKNLPRYCLALLTLCCMTAHACKLSYTGIFCESNAWDKLSSASVFIPGDNSKTVELDYNFGKDTLDIGMSTNQRVILYKDYYFASKSLGALQKHGYAVEAMEALLTNLKTNLYLLDRAFPKGPSSITHKQAIKLSGNQGLRVVTNPGLVANIPAPWSATGYIIPEKNHRYAFELTVNSSSRVGPSVTKGTLTYGQRNYSLPKSFDLKNYNVIGLLNTLPTQNFSDIESLEKIVKTHKKGPDANIGY